MPFHLLLSLVIGCAGLHVQGGDPAHPPPQPAPVQGLPWPDLIVQTMPSVVLLLAEREGRTDGFGAGVLISDEGLLLTNLHIVEGADALRVLPYHPERTSYSPLEGGIQRLIFEHEEDLLGAEVLRRDPVLDLALVRTRGFDQEVRPLPLREEAIRVGEPVLALGHPQQSVWSFTAGVVSAIHQGLIQHDAPLNQGNSGGPLIDAQGRLVGINTIKLLGGSEGLAFARPIGLALPLIDGRARHLQLDFTAPDKAFLSCEQAVDLAPWQALDCVWWDGEHQQLLAAVERIKADLALPPEVADRLDAQVWELGRASWIGRWQLQVVDLLSGGALDETASTDLDYGALWDGPQALAGWLEGSDAPERLRTRYRALQERDRTHREQVATRGGASEELDPTAFREARHLGQRLEELWMPTDNLALLRVQAHLPDGRPHGYTECWVLVPGGWRQRMLCPPSYVQRIPESWPLPRLDHDAFLERFEIELSARILDLDLGVLTMEP